MLESAFYAFSQYLFTAMRNEKSEFSDYKNPFFSP